MHQRGHGLMSMFSSFGRKIKPWLKKFGQNITPLVRNRLKNYGSQLVKTGGEILTKAAQGGGKRRRGGGVRRGRVSKGKKRGGIKYQDDEETESDESYIKMPRISQPAIQLPTADRFTALKTSLVAKP